LSNLGQVNVSSGGFLGVHASGAAAAGPLSIAAGNLAINGAVAQDFSAVGSFSGSGAAGNVTVNLSGDLSITGGAELGSDASSDLTNAGTDSGQVHVSARDISISGTGPSTPSGASASSLGSYSGTGIDGSVRVQADNLTILRNGEISTLANELGSSGDIQILISGATTLDGAGGLPRIITGITAQNQKDSQGAAGAVSVSTGSLRITNQAEIASTTFGSGPGGEVNVSVHGAATLIGGLENGFLTGITTQSNRRAAGDAGNVIVSAGTLKVMDASAISSTALGSGDGGGVKVTAGSLVVQNNGKISAESTGSGTAGNVKIAANAGDVSLSGNADVLVSAAANKGGTLSLSSSGDIVVRNSTISAAAALDGGDITVNSPGLIYLSGSQITGQAGATGMPGQNGGVIRIDPRLVIMNRSVIDGLASGRDVLVAIGADELVVSTDSLILTNDIAFTVDTNVTAGLLGLPQPAFGGSVALVPACAVMPAGGASSFVVTGNGGLPPEPGGFISNQSTADHIPR
jgi:hypothetical protein